AGGIQTKRDKIIVSAKAVKFFPMVMSFLPGFSRQKIFPPKDHNTGRIGEVFFRFIWNKALKIRDFSAKNGIFRPPSGKDLRRPPWGLSSGGSILVKVRKDQM
ncbi:MAG TPA: hypothetical protein PLY89_08555, partial [Synergistaceae bacterium]|nr:hypothetical protein [Synergistaceae bacterium]